MTRLLAMVFLLLGYAAAAGETAPVLSLPIGCTLGTDCFIQQYPDVIPGPGAKDYRCGIAANDNHKGTDFRVLSVNAAKSGVPVLAAAAGRVKAVRNTLEDRLARSDEDRMRIEGVECGNGIVIDLGDGWETQYCHLLRGSVKVRKGQKVDAGTPLGLVGYSGAATFAHLHFSVRRNGKVVDPFLGEIVSGTCREDPTLPASSLWRTELRAQLAYRDTPIIETGFASAPLSPDEAEEGEIAQPSATGPALVFFARLINMHEGDELRLAIQGPQGFDASGHVEPLERNKPHFVAYAGKKLRDDRWPSGLYIGTVDLIRNGAVIGTAENSFELP